MATEMEQDFDTGGDADLARLMGREEAAPEHEDIPPDYDMTDRHRADEDEPKAEDKAPAKKAAEKAKTTEKNAEKAAEKAPFTPEQLADRDRQSRSALKEERDARRAAEERAQRIERNFETLLQRFPQLGGQPQQQQPTEQVDLREVIRKDPTRVLEALAQKVQQFEHQEVQTRQAHAAQRQYEQVSQQVVSRVEQFETEFRDEAPDYDEAAQHFIGARVAMLRAGGYGEAQARALITQELIQGGYTAIQSGQNPARLIYEAAKTMGWTPKPPPVVQEEAVEREETSPAEKLAQQRDKQAAARSLGNGGGGRQSAGVSLKQLLELEGADFDDKMKDFEKRMRRGGFGR